MILYGILVGRYWIITETSTNAFVATLKDFLHPSRSWFCLCSIKNLNTGCNSNLCTSYFQFSYGIQEKEALGLQEPVLFEGAKRVTRRDPSTWRTPFWYLIGSPSFDPYWTDRHCTLLYGDCNGRRGSSLENQTQPLCFIWRKNMVFKTV